MVLLLAIKLIAGALCHVAPPGRAMSYVDDVLGTIMICAPGTSTAAPDDIPAVPAPKPLECPACTLAALLLFAVVLALLGLIISPPAPSVPRRRVAPSLAIHLASGAVRSRAPPILS